MGDRGGDAVDANDDSISVLVVQAHEVGAQALQRDARTWQASCDGHEKRWFGPPRPEESYAADDAIVHALREHATKAAS